MKIVKNILLLLVTSALFGACDRYPVPEVVPVERPIVTNIYGTSKHAAFPSLVEFNGAYYCAFREAALHTGSGGVVRIIRTTDGNTWTDHATLELELEPETEENPTPPAFTGSGLKVDASQKQYIRIAHHTDFDFANDGRFTVTAKVKTAAGNGHSPIVSTRNGGAGYEVLTSGGMLMCDMANPYYRAIQTTGTINENSWHHVAFVWDGASSTKAIYLYTDGENGTTVAHNGTNVISTQANDYGNDILLFCSAGRKDLILTNPTGGRHWSGEIESLRFYSRALTADEIKDDMEGDVTMETPGLIAAYDFSVVEGTGSDLSVPDIKGKHPATLCNFYREGDGSIPEPEARPTDLRDPKLYVTADNRLMLMTDGEIYDGEVITSRRPYVSYSDVDGNNFSKLERSKVYYPTEGELSEDNFWIWKLNWSDGVGYGFDYLSKFALFSTTDYGKTFKPVVTLDRNEIGNPSEADLCFDSNGKAYAFIRRNGEGSTWENSRGYLATSMPPYTDWDYKMLDYRVEGQCVLMYNDDKFIIGTRRFNEENASPQMAVIVTDLEGKLLKETVLLSSGDCSYPGMVINGDELWVAYYSTHHGISNIYFTKIPLSELLEE